MHSRKIVRWWPLGLVLLAAMVAAAILASSSGESDDALVVYNGRSHYGGDAYDAFTRETGVEVEVFGGDAEELHQRLVAEGSDTPADVLVTVDGANLWRAQNERLLAPIRSRVVAQAIPGELRDLAGGWTALSTRVRTPMRSTTRVAAGDVREYEDLGDRRWRGRLCLRTSNNIYNQSLVADMIAKRGRAETERLLRSWMANRPRILGSDVEVIKAIAGGQCDVGLANHYYLARMLTDEPDTPVTPVWAGQDGEGSHANLSGAGVVRFSNRRDDAERLIEFLVGRTSQRAIVANGEFAANPSIAPAKRIASWAEVETDPIDVAAAGRHAQDAVALMATVRWR